MQGTEGEEKVDSVYSNLDNAWKRVEDLESVSEDGYEYLVEGMDVIDYDGF